MPSALVTLSARPRDCATLSVAVVIGPDGKLPEEIRLFKPGINDTEKGPYLFDAEAARMVMAHQEAMGAVDRMIDLEHLSLDDSSPSYDPDARGWCRLEVRNGELWAVQMSWTPDGIERLTSRKQRYLSPAFPADEDGRITKIVNIALTAVPATHDAPALVAASQRRKKQMNPELLKLLSRMGRYSGMLVRLAEEAPAEGAKGKAAAVSEAAQAAQDALEAYMKAAKGSDIDATFAALEEAKKAVDAFENAANALTGAPPDADAPPPAPAPETEAALRALSALTGRDTIHGAVEEVRRMSAVAAAHEAEVKRLAAERKVVENGHRRELVGQLVVLGVLTPAMAWADAEATTPKGTYAKLSIEELKELVLAHGGAPKVPEKVVPAGSGSAVQVSRVQIDDHEIARLKATMDREKRNNPKANFRSFDKTLANYVSIRNAQLAGAESGTDRAACQRLSRGVKQTDVLTTPVGELVTLASVQQYPISQMGPSSQRAMEEFRLEFNSTLVSLPIPWAEDLGVVLPGGGLKDTYPLSFYAIKYREQRAENPNAVNPNSADVSVIKKLFSAAAQAELIRIAKGDFAYIQAWGQSAANMARARVNLRNHLITDLLEAGTSGYWGQTADQATGIDGQPFFSASHKVNPFDPLMKLHGAATWGNYSGTAYPLSAGNLTTVKALMLGVPGPDGEELGSRATGLLNPTSLDETARLLLTVQDLILDAAASLKSVSNVMGGGVRNEHFNSGFEHIWAPQLAGTDATADYYLFSRETIGRGLPPWVLAEDAAEEVRIWDENSDFYKNSGFIKTGSYVYCNAALLYPHGIRLVKGA